jgi:O-acetyl-ADP-ribose deacetylase (regulator of RNase III)
VIEFKTGNIFNEPADGLVNTVNCVGVMGRGIAAQFKKVYPQNFKDYAHACKDGLVQPGKMFVVKVSDLTSPRYIINFPTKRHWKTNSRIEDIELGLSALAETVEQCQLKSVAIPPLGCGLGGLNWNDVRPLIEKFSERVSATQVIVFEPAADTDTQEVRPTQKIPQMTAGRAALIRLIDQCQKELLEPGISALEIHKLMYFMQESGEPLRLSYAKGPYGPFAENLKIVLELLEGHYTIGHCDGGDSPTKEIDLLPGAREEAEKFLVKQDATLARFKRVSDLIEGYESAFGLELLASVHWAVTKEDAKGSKAAYEAISSWDTHKQKFSERQIELSYNTLVQNEWLSDYSTVPLQSCNS